MMAAGYLFVRLLTGALLLQTPLAPLQGLASGARRDTRMVVAAEDGSRLPTVNQCEGRDPAPDPTERFASLRPPPGSPPPPVVPLFRAAPSTAWPEAPDPGRPLGAGAAPFDATGPPSLFSRAFDHQSHPARLPVVLREKTSL